MTASFALQVEVTLVPTLPAFFLYTATCCNINAHRLHCIVLVMIGHPSSCSQSEGESSFATDTHNERCRDVVKD